MKSLIIGQDIGFGSNKLVGPNGEVEVNSHVAVKTGEKFSDLVIKTGKDAPVQITLADGTTYYVGKGSHHFGRPIESVDLTRLLGSTEARVQLYATLSKYAQVHKAGDNLEISHLTVGLPLEMLRGQTARTNASAMKQWLLGNHAWMINGLLPMSASIENVAVTSQAGAAFYEWAYNDSGQVQNKRALGSVAIVAIGFKTSELMALEDGAPVPNKTGGVNFGVKDFLQPLADERSMTLGEMDAKLRAGKIPLKGSGIDNWNRQLIGHVSKILNGYGDMGKRFECIYVCGGGTHLVNKTFSAALGTNVQIAHDPVFTVARGLYKMAVFNQSSHAQNT